MSAPSRLSADSSYIRTITDEEGQTWFVLKDLLNAIGSTTKTTGAVSAIYRELKEGRHVMHMALETTGGEQRLIAVSHEAATYLVMTAKTTLARAVQLSVLKSVNEHIRLIQALKEFEVPEELPDMFVYAIRERETRRIKLGISRNPEKRLAQLQIGNSQELELVAHMPATNRFQDERSMQAQCAPMKIRGEWFSHEAEGAILDSHALLSYPRSILGEVTD